MTPTSLKGNKAEKKKIKSDQKEQQQNVTRNEATAFSILYNNLFYLFFVILLGFFVLKALPSLYNYVLSVGISAALVMLSSTSKTE